MALCYLDNVTLFLSGLAGVGVDVLFSPPVEGLVSLLATGVCTCK